jgi:serine O-acetyltransferase
MPGFQAIAVHRFGVWRKRVPLPARLPLTALYWGAQLVIRNVYGIQLQTTVQVGRRVGLPHGGKLIIAPGTVIGDDCVLLHNVTLGAGRELTEVPKLGRNVKVGIGAVVLGSITIGDNVTIGPNAVVLTDVPPGATVFTDPARIVKPPRKAWGDS